MLNRRAKSRSTLVFPWERGGEMRRWLRVGRLRSGLWGLALIGGLTLIGVREWRDSGMRQTRATLLSVRQAVDAYMAAHQGSCPAELADVARYGNFRSLPLDAWGKPLRLICPAAREGASYSLMSDGPDRKPGGLDRVE